MLYHVIKIQIVLILLFAVGSYVSYICRIASIQKLYQKILDHCVHLDSDEYRRIAFRLVISEIFGFFLLNCLYHIFFVTFTFDFLTMFDIVVGIIIR